MRACAEAVRATSLTFRIETLRIPREMLLSSVVCRSRTAVVIGAELGFRHLSDLILQGKESAVQRVEIEPAGFLVARYLRFSGPR